MAREYRLRHVAGPTPPTGTEAELVVTPRPVSFLGEVEPREGLLKRPGETRRLGGRIMVFPQSRGSTVGSYVIYALSFYKNAPLAMVVEKAEPLLITGCVIGGIPLLVFEEKPDYEELGRCGKAVITRNSGGYKMACVTG